MSKEGTCKGFKSGLALAFDGTCSGLQHFSALFGMKSGTCSKPDAYGKKVQDIYSIVAEKVNTKVLDDAQNGEVRRRQTKRVTSRLIRTGSP